MWDFYRHIPGRPERDPQELEFFHTPSGWCDPLVREIIQNSLDAINKDSKKVIVSFKIINTPSKTENHLTDLLDHYEVCYDKFSTTKIKNSKTLIIEDFGTTGLDGSISRNEKLNINSNFYMFWWYEGSSFKGGKSRGRWGLGKTVLHGASKLRAFWGYTCRSDKKKYLMGKAIYKNHTYKDKRYEYAGYYGTWKKSKDYSDLKSATPIEDSSLLDEFKGLFSLKRNEQSGLSLVIPFIKDEINFENIIKYSIENYFFPLINDNLEIQVNNNKKIEIINSKSIYKLAKKYDSRIGKADIEEQLKFLRSTCNFNNNDLVKLASDGTDVSFNIEKDKLNKIQELYTNNHLLGFRIKTLIKPKNEEDQYTYYDAYIQRSNDLKRAEEFYVRSGIIIRDIKTLKTPVRALLIAEDELISRFLGDAENPAHTDWKENTEGFKDKYDKAHLALRLIKNTFIQLVSKIDIPTKDKDNTLLSDHFPKIITNGKGKYNNDTRNNISSPDFNIKKYKDGFRLSLKNNKISLPKRIDVSIAYDVISGDPFSKWKPFDFDLSSIKIIGSGSENNKYRKMNNTISLTVVKEDFFIKVLGFDKKRDLVVKVIEADKKDEKNF